jgi:hypothetical protein
VDDAHAVGELRQEQALFQGAISTAHDDHVFAAEEEAVAGRTVADAATDEFIFTGDAQAARRGSGRDDQRLRFVLLTVRLHIERRAIQQIDGFHFVEDKPCAELFGLFLHQLD